MSSSVNQLLLSVVIPAHNEQENLEPTVTELTEVLSAQLVPYEIVVVNDNSTDRTQEVAESLAETDPGIRVLARARLPGFGRAIRAGLAAATGDVVVIVMADRSDDPADVVRYYRKIEEGYDCVFGSRFRKGSKCERYPRVKLAFNRLVNTFIQMVFLTRFNDLTNAFKAYRRNVIQECGPFAASHFNITIEMSLSALIRKYHIAEIPINWYGRTSGVSKLRLTQMGRRYLSVLLRMFFEKVLISDDILDERLMEKNQVPDGSDRLERRVEQLEAEVRRLRAGAAPGMKRSESAPVSSAGVDEPSHETSDPALSSPSERSGSGTGNVEPEPVASGAMPASDGSGNGRVLDQIYDTRFSQDQPDRLEWRRNLWKVLVDDYFSRWIPREGTVLDFGCGMGEFINAVQARRRIGVDMRAGAKDNLDPQVEFVLSDDVSMPGVGDREVDIVFCSNLLEHLPDRDTVTALFRETERVLRPDGRMLILGPNLRYTESAYWDFFDHILPFTEHSLAEALATGGLEPEILHPRFLPYTTVGASKTPLFLVRWYLRMPIAWRFMGAQFSPSPAVGALERGVPMELKEIVITGGSGFVGSSIAVRLKRDLEGVSVYAFDNLMRRGSELNLSRLEKAGVEFMHGDIRCQEDLARLPSFDLLIDCSAEPSVHAGASGSPTTVLNTNLTGSLNCFETARQQNAAILFLSSSRVYPIEPLNALAHREGETRFVLLDEQQPSGCSAEGVTEDFPLTGARSFLRSDQACQ